MLEQDRPGRATGPLTPHGKQRSSENAITHGCCSAKLFVADEKQEDFDRLRAYWFNEFAAVIPGTEDPQAAKSAQDVWSPLCAASEALVEQLVLDHWLLKRAQRNYISVEYELSASDPMQWLPGDEHKLRLMIRYKTAAERSFDRSLRAVQRFMKERISLIAATNRLQTKLAESPAPPSPPISQRAAVQTHAEESHASHDFDSTSHASQGSRSSDDWFGPERFPFGNLPSPSARFGKSPRERTST